MEELTVHLRQFDGPLDLLLHLIQKNKIDIYDIPIVEIVEQYMQAIHQMEEENLDLTSDFVAMAAQLLYIKSKMLLPVYEEEEQEDPRAQLVEMLLEYQRFQQVSAFFHERTEIGKNIMVREPAALDTTEGYDYQHTPEDLVQAAKRMLSKWERRMPPPVTSFQGIVGTEKVPVSQQIPRILQRFVQEKAVSFLHLFDGAKSRSKSWPLFWRCWNCAAPGGCRYASGMGTRICIWSWPKTRRPSRRR